MCKRKVRVAIIDSGIDTDFYKKNENISELYIVDKNNSVLSVFNHTISNIHGTICSAIINQLSNNVEIIGIQVINDYNVCSINALISAIKFCVAQSIDIVNLSLGTIEIEDIIEMYQPISTLINKGTIVVSPVGKMGKIAYPGAYENVIGVDASNDYLPHVWKLSYPKKFESLDKVKNEIISNLEYKK